MSTHLTREGLEKLQKELEFLRTTKRKEIIEAIAVAREKGDLRENAEYDAAKEAQGYLEKRIAELTDQLSHVVILDDQDIDNSKIVIGAKVTLKDIGKDTKILYHLVSQAEADFANGKISMISPVGKALLNKEVGDEVQVKIPAGTLKYKVLKIER